MNRRDFIIGSVGAAAGAAVTGRFSDVLAGPKRTGKQEIPKRRYRDGVNLSVVGYGGIVVVGQEQEAANRSVAAAFERGVNYFDVAPSYGDGEAEEKLGIALKPLRNKSFLACKTQARDAEGARKEFEQSLARLHTDYFDLYQHHAVTKMDDVEAILAPGGALEFFREQQEKGHIRYLGFSAHSEEAAVALMDAYDYDSILFPVNYVCWESGSFGPRVLEKAREKGVSQLALKALAYTPWENWNARTYTKCWYEPIDERDLALRALRFTLGEGVTAAIPPGDERIFELALDLASEGIEPLPAGDRRALLASAEKVKPIFSTS